MSKTAVVVDDTAFMRLSLKNILENNEYEVVGEGADGQQALELYKQYKPSLMTMDITMPKINGIKAVQEILAYDSNAVIIMVSAMGQKELVMEALNAGAKDFVLKPFQPKRVAEALAKLEESSGGAEEDIITGDPEG
ncbi:MAG: response regulator [Bacillota bacterium]